MSGLREQVRQHLDAAIAEATSRGLGEADVVCRTMLQELTEIWLAKRSLADVQGELRFVSDNLDPDTDFEFMRP
ncbi:MAG: hypothetical protein JRH01_01745 [Deltaproteobacteria bacterium]|nr:hypothetical protein [Deltaproteobacteria bacterium]MBW2394664.1 hypothetical protein [Deltaproteobacteria bacterium]